ncbi:MAG: hypothetical protein EOP49_37625, partial [Sphingobacteriales bacterium]
MKKIALQCILALALVSAMAVSCQKEEDDVSQPNPENLAKDSELTGLLQRMCTPDSISDNLVDSTACFRINRPYKVFIHESTATLALEYDMNVTDSQTQQQLNDLLVDLTPGEDYAALYFPVTVTFADGTETVVHNQQELNIARMHCDPAGGSSTDPITCGNINYPVTIFSYNANFQVADTYTITSDAELYAMLSNVVPGQFFAIDFPVSLTLNDGTILTANNNQELVNNIQQAISFCGVPIINPCNNTDILTNGLILYMPIAGEAIDLISSNIAAHTPNYPPAFVDDRDGNVNGAVSFSGNNSDYLKFLVTDNNNIESGDSVTVSLWYKSLDTDQGNFEHLFEKSDASGNNPGFGLALYDLNRALFYESNTFNLWESSFASDNNWHHLVFVKASTAVTNQVYLYKDGQLVASNTAGNLFINTQA